MKYLEQRVEQLEKEVNLLKAKNKLKETKTTGFTSTEDNTARYINNYPSSQNWKDRELNDYMFNSSVNLISEPDLETAFASPFDRTEIGRNSLDTISSTSSSYVLIKDNTYEQRPVAPNKGSWSEEFKPVTAKFNTSKNEGRSNPDYVDSFDLPSYYPEYPGIIGSWDDKPYNEVVSKNTTDEYGFKLNYDELTPTWNIETGFDKLDKNFLEWLNTEKPFTIKALFREYKKWNDNENG